MIGPAQQASRINHHFNLRSSGLSHVPGASQDKGAAHQQYSWGRGENTKRKPASETDIYIRAHPASIGAEGKGINTHSRVATGLEEYQQESAVDALAHTLHAAVGTRPRTPSTNKRKRSSSTTIGYQPFIAHRT